MKKLILIIFILILLTTLFIKYVNNLKKYPRIYRLRDLYDKLADNPEMCECDGKWYPGRPLGYMSFRSRLRATLMVFTGKADAVIWPGKQ